MKFCKNISLEDIKKCKNLESLVNSIIEDNKNKTSIENLKFLKILLKALFMVKI